MSNISALKNLPDINFVEKNVDTMLAEAIAGYENAHYQQTGIRKRLAAGDPVRIWIYSQVLREYALYQKIDHTGKQTLLKYAQGPFLDHRGALIGETRNPPFYAVSTVRFTLSAVRPVITPIPSGTRVSPDGSIFFETTAYKEIPAWQPHIDVIVRCVEPGEVGNGFTAGQINILVDPIPYVAEVSNTDTSQGGIDEESDESLREQIFLKPDSFSVAGPKGAYEYWTREFDASIIDVAVSSSSPGVVDIRFLLTGGEIPESAMIESVAEYLSSNDRRPLTDLVVVDAPSQVPYDIDLTYYIRSSDSRFAISIQGAVDQAVAEYVSWQKAKIGRSINPSQLVSLVIQAGAKRVEITAPEFLALSETQIAIENEINVTYGGLENE